MIRTLLALYAYSQAPKATFTLLHPVRALQVAKTPFDLRTAYAPRLTALATAAIVAPLAYRLGKRAGAGRLHASASPGIPSPCAPAGSISPAAAAAATSARASWSGPSSPVVRANSATTTG